MTHRLSLLSNARLSGLANPVCGRLDGRRFVFVDEYSTNSSLTLLYKRAGFVRLVTKNQKLVCLESNGSIRASFVIRELHLEDPRFQDLHDCSDLTAVEAALGSSRVSISGRIRGECALWAEGQLWALYGKWVHTTSSIERFPLRPLCSGTRAESITRSSRYAAVLSSVTRVVA